MNLLQAKSRPAGRLLYWSEFLPPVDAATYVMLGIFVAIGAFITAKSYAK